MAIKALEEARKKGIAPAELDEEGREINPHIPHYIVKAPWYVSTGAASLKHQRATAKEQPLPADAARTKGVSGQATKYRKGACENCGSISHEAKACLDRPRAKGARWTGDDIRPDDYAVDVPLDFEGKRDRWAGFDADDYRAVIEGWERAETERKRVRPDADDQDDALYAEQADMPGQEVDQKARMTVRNLRLREDTAKYLRNLDPDSAYYDPKTRSMRENPHPDTPTDDLDYAGDTEGKWDGEAGGIAEMQVFAWQAAERGADISLQANPTEAARRFKAHQQTKKEQVGATRAALIERYGPAPSKPAELPSDDDSNDADGGA